jgi:hypothetical protein
MKLGSKVTVLFPVPRYMDERHPGVKFLRCYVIRRLSAGWQLYDPVRNWSWGLRDEDRGLRVAVG